MMFSWLKNFVGNRAKVGMTGAQSLSNYDEDLAEITQFLLGNNHEIVFWTDVAGNFQGFNDATCKALGYSRAELNSMKVADIDPEITPESHQAMLQILEAGEPFIVQTRPIRKDGTARTLEFSVKRLVVNERVYLCTFGHEIKMEKQLRDGVLDSIAQGRPLSETLNLIVQLAESTRIGMLGSIMLLDDQNLLRVAASNQLSDEYCQLLDGIAPGPTVGSCGTAAYRSESVMVEDIQASPLWAAYAQIAEKENIRACWSEPIFSSTNEVLGTVAMYFRKISTPTDVDHELMKSFARFAGIAIERQQEHEILRRNEMRFRSLVQFSSATLWTTSPSGEFLTPQESWEAYTGQNWEEQKGFGWSKMIHPEDRDRLLKTWLVAIDAKQNYHSDGRIWHAKSETYRHFEVNGVPVIDGDQLVEWTGCTVDVHDRKMAEEMLLKNEGQLRTITNSLPVCIGYIDDEYRYQFNNAMYETMYGRSAAEIKGKTVSEVVGKTSFLQAKPQLDAALQGEVITFEQRHKGVDGVSRISETRLVPDRNAQGEINGIYALSDDITNRRALEKEVLSVSVLQQRRMGQDLHDGIGQELTGLGMIADTMVLALDGTDRREKFIAEKLAEGIKRTLRQVKLLARGLNPVDISPTGIYSALAEMARHVEDLYEITCIVKYDSDIQIFDDQTSTNVFRIAQEATTNAAKHGRAGTVQINLDKFNNVLDLSIVDDGCGFDMNNRISHGMGMRTMEYRAGVIGARLEITSSEGSGTVVSCQIPLQESMMFANQTGQIQTALHSRSTDSRKDRLTIDGD